MAYGTKGMVLQRDSTSQQHVGVDSHSVGTGSIPKSSNNIVMLVLDTSGVLAYLNKQRGMAFLPLCTLVQQAMEWTELHNVDLQMRHIPGRMNVVPNKLILED